MAFNNSDDKQCNWSLYDVTWIEFILLINTVTSIVMRISIDFHVQSQREIIGALKVVSQEIPESLILHD